MNAEIFRGVRAVVLFDLDGTFIKESNCQTHPELPALLKTAAAAGIRCGWASSTSDLGLQAWEHQLGIAPGSLPVRISEDGVLCTAPAGWLPHRALHGDRTWFTTDDNLIGRREQFRQLRDELRRWTRLDQDWAWIETHPSTWARQCHWLPPAHPAVIVCDCTRTASFTCEVRQIVANGGRPGRLQANPPLTQELVRPAVAAAAKRASLATALLDHGLGWIDLPHPFATKGAALRELRQRVPAQIPIILVGNGSNDLSAAGIDGIQLVAVSDAKPELKAVAHHVTAAPNHDGCHEYLSEVLLAVTA